MSRLLQISKLVGLVLCLLALAGVCRADPNSEELRKQGIGLIFKGKFEQGLPLVRKALSLKEKAHGKNSPEVIDLLRSLGITSAFTGKHKFAIETFQDSIRRSEASGNWKSQAEGWSDLGYPLRSLKRYKEALESYEKSLELRKQNGLASHQDTLNLYKEVARCYDGLGKAQKALEICDLSLKQMKPSYYRTDLLIYASEIATVESPSKAEGYLVEALEQVESTVGLKHGQAGQVLLSLAQHHMDRKQFRKSEQYLNQALKLAPTSFNKELEGQVWNGLGILFFQSKEFEKSLAAFQSCYLAYSKLPNQRVNRMLALSRGADIAARLELFDLAATDLRKSIEFADLKIDQIKLYRTLSDVLGKARNLPESLEARKTALELSVEHKGYTHPLTGDLMVEVALAEFDQGLYGESIDRLEKARLAFSETKYLAKGASSLLAVIYGVGGQTDKAREILEQFDQEDDPLIHTARGLMHLSVNNFGEALKELESGGDFARRMVYLRAHCHYKVREYDKCLALIRSRSSSPDPRWNRLLAQVLESKGELMKALVAHRDAKEQLNRYSSTLPGLRAEILGGLGVMAFKMYEKTGEADYLAEAQKNLAAALQAVEGIRAQSGHQKTGRLLSRDHFPIYSYAVETEIAHGNLAGAVQIAETAVARELQRASIKGKVLEQSPAALKVVEALKKLDFQQQLLENRFGSASPDSVDRLAKSMEDLKARRKIEEERLFQALPSFRTLSLSSKVDLPKIQAGLSVDELCLFYFQSSPKSFLFAIDRSEVLLTELPSTEKISKLVERVTESVSGGQTRATVVGVSEQVVDPVREELGKMILGPVAHKMGGKKKLLVIPTGSFLELPFESLPDPLGSKYLVQRFDLAYFPSLSLLDRKPSTGVGKALIVADPEYKKFAPLPFTGKEAQELAQVFRGAKIEVQNLQGSQASLAGVERLSWLDYRFLHFATHGMSSSPPGLVLAKDEKLTMGKIMSLQLKADLVVLSACQSGRGELLPGEGVLSLSRAFLLAGAKSVVVSLWNVDDRSTAKLMTYFYQQMLGQGLPPSKALNEAQRRMLAEGYKPRHWAPFIVFGGR